MNLNIVCIPGDGIGPEVIGETLKVLDKIGEKYGHTFEYTPNDRWFNLISKSTGISVDIIKKEIGDILFTDVRQMLQVIGTDLIRKYCPNWHVDKLTEDINSYSDDYVIVIDDVRFKNEKEAIEKTEKAIDVSLKNLQTDYIDLLLIHEPYDTSTKMYKSDQR